MSHIKTRWADKIDIEKPLAEYPRPQLVRNDWPVSYTHLTLPTICSV